MGGALVYAADTDLGVEMITSYQNIFNRDMSRYWVVWAHRIRLSAVYVYLLMSNLLFLEYLVLACDEIFEHLIKE